MTRLVDLPAELLIIIFEHLESIDDALHLGRSCKLMYEVLDPVGHRLSIFSHIIQNGEHHKCDIRLDASETFCADFRNKHYTTDEPLSKSERPLFSAELFGGRMPDSTYRKLDPDTVWSIVTRWHALKVLFDLYCDSTIRPWYLDSIFWQTTDQRQSLTLNFDDYGKRLPPPSGKNCSTIQFKTTADKMAAYARFYRSVCSHWLHVNMAWTAGISRHADSIACEDTFGMIKTLWLDDRTRSSLQEKTEAIEVTDFVWGFLALKLFAAPSEPGSFGECLRPNEFSDEPILWDLPRYTSPYTRLVRMATFYLPPSHIIELLLEMWTPKSIPQFSHPADSCRVNKGLYLRRLGFFDKKQGTLEDNLNEVPVYSWFSTEILTMMEWWGIDRLLGERSEFKHPFTGINPLPYVKWQQYRLSRWKNDLRGQPILYPQSDQNLVRRINGSGHV